MKLLPRFFSTKRHSTHTKRKKDAAETHAISVGCSDSQNAGARCAVLLDGGPVHIWCEFRQAWIACNIHCGEDLSFLHWNATVPGPHLDLKGRQVSHN